MSYALRDGLNRAINIILAIIGFFIGLRIVLRLVSANETTPFVSWVYGISEFFISPFRGIVGNVGIQTGIVDIVAIIALAVYLIIGYLLMSLINAAVRDRDYYISDNSAAAHYHDVRRTEDDTISHEHHR